MVFCQLSEAKKQFIERNKNMPNPPTKKGDAFYGIT
jgi:hypothetical protein